jgi:hypothetical protein
LEENQVVTILKALISAAEDYIGDVETVKLEKREKDKLYTHDRIIICGVSDSDGRQFELKLELEDPNEVE